MSAPSMRLAVPADAGAIREIYAPYVRDSVISFETTVPTTEDIAGRIAATLAAHPWLVALASGRIVGYAYAHPFAARAAYRWSTETSIYVAAEAHRTGVGRALYSTLLGLLEAQGYREALAGITMPNPASIALHESMGFGQVATFRRVGWKAGSWHDVGWWQRRLGAADQTPADDAPAEPLRLDDMTPGVMDRALAWPGTGGPGAP